MSRLAQLAQRRAVLQAEIAATRATARAAALELGRDAAVGFAASALTRLLPRRWRWGVIAAVGLGLLAAKFLRSGPQRDGP